MIFCSLGAFLFLTYCLHWGSNPLRIYLIKIAFDCSYSATQQFAILLTIISTLSCLLFSELKWSSCWPTWRSTTVSSALSIGPKPVTWTTWPPLTWSSMSDSARRSDFRTTSYASWRWQWSAARPASNRRRQVERSGITTTSSGRTSTHRSTHLECSTSSRGSTRSRPRLLIGQSSFTVLQALADRAPWLPSTLWRISWMTRARLPSTRPFVISDTTETTLYSQW